MRQLFNPAAILTSDPPLAVEVGKTDLETEYYRQICLNGGRASDFHEYSDVEYSMVLFYCKPN
jgi:hypothetical protein